MASPLSAALCPTSSVPLGQRQEYMTTWCQMVSVPQQCLYLSCVLLKYTPTGDQQTLRHLLRSHCSIRRRQYWKAFSLSRSFGGSSRLEEEVAETMETTEPSTSERSSATWQFRKEMLRKKNEINKTIQWGEGFFSYWLASVGMYTKCSSTVRLDRTSGIPLDN